MNKTVLITGGNRGIGKACAEKFAKKKYNIIINYINNDIEANKTKKYLEQNYQTKVTLLKGDISNEETVINLINKLKENNITIDTLINNAGIAIDNDIENKTSEEFMQVIKTNLLGTYLMSKRIKKIMQTGTIINISSNNAINSPYVESIDYDA